MKTPLWNFLAPMSVAEARRSINGMCISEAEEEDHDQKQIEPVCDLRRLAAHTKNTVEQFVKAQAEMYQALDKLMEYNTTEVVDAQIEAITILNVAQREQEPALDRYGHTLHLLQTHSPQEMKAILDIRTDKAAIDLPKEAQRLHDLSRQGRGVIYIPHKDRKTYLHNLLSNERVAYPIDVYFLSPKHPYEDVTDLICLRIHWIDDPDNRVLGTTTTTAKANSLKSLVMFCQFENAPTYGLHWTVGRHRLDLPSARNLFQSTEQAQQALRKAGHELRNPEERKNIEDYMEDRSWYAKLNIGWVQLSELIRYRIFWRDMPNQEDMDNDWTFIPGEREWGYRNNDEKQHLQQQLIQYDQHKWGLQPTNGNRFLFKPPEESFAKSVLKSFRENPTKIPIPIPDTMDQEMKGNDAEISRRQYTIMPYSTDSDIEKFLLPASEYFLETKHTKSSQPPVKAPPPRTAGKRRATRKK
jgi:hypothetical protein